MKLLMIRNLWGYILQQLHTSWTHKYFSILYSITHSFTNANEQFIPQDIINKKNGKPSWNEQVGILENW